MVFDSRRNKMTTNCDHYKDRKCLKGHMANGLCRANGISRILSVTDMIDWIQPCYEETIKGGIK